MRLLLRTGRGGTAGFLKVIVTGNSIPPKYNKVSANKEREVPLEGETVAT
jgi:hypothetical protein